MSRLIRPAPQSVEELGQEFVDHGLSGWIWTWLAEGLRLYVHCRLKPRYRPSLYSPSGEWDREGTGDLVNEFIVQRVSGTTLLYRAIRLADSVAGVQRYVETVFHHYVIRERGQSVARNVYDRLREVLRDDPELRVIEGLGPSAAYGRADWDDPAPADEAALAAAERFLPLDLRRTEYTTGSRRSPVLERQELLRAARALICGVGQPLTARQILKVIRRRFDLEEAGEIGLDDDALSDLASDADDPLERVAADEAGAKLLSVLSTRQQAVLRHLAEEMGCRESAEALGCGKSTIANERKAVLAAARSVGLAEPDEQMQAIRMAAMMLETADASD